jgi:CBS-domain-containing membrane protein
LLLGSYGALATLLFAAPQAPVSQPRMVLGGHAIAILVAIAFDRISEPAYGTAILPREMAVGLAPAVAITAMQILGLTHPPAGAAVLVFLFYPESIRQMGLLFYVPVYLGCFILVLMALVINNAFSFRPAYPRFW